MATVKNKSTARREPVELMEDEATRKVRAIIAEICRNLMPKALMWTALIGLKDPALARELRAKLAEFDLDAYK